MSGLSGPNSFKMQLNWNSSGTPRVCVTFLTRCRFILIGGIFSLPFSLSKWKEMQFSLSTSGAGRQRASAALWWHGHVTSSRGSQTGTRGRPDRGAMDCQGVRPRARAGVGTGPEGESSYRGTDGDNACRNQSRMCEKMMSIPAGFRCTLGNEAEP